MLTSLITCAVLTAAGATTDASLESLAGKVRVAGSRFRPVVSVVVADKPVPLKGELLAEIGRLHSITVEVIGRREEGTFVVHGYKILDIGRGAKPLVGIVHQEGDHLFLKDGDGDGVPLSVSPRSRMRLVKKVGAKVWIHGKKLVSGEYKILRYGVLREASEVGQEAPATPPAQPTPTPKQEETANP